MFIKNNKDDLKIQNEEELIPNHVLKEIYYKKKDVREVQARMAILLGEEEVCVENYIVIYDIHIYNLETLHQLKEKCIKKDTIMSRAFCKAIEELIDKKKREEKLEEADVNALEMIFEELGMEYSAADGLGSKVMGRLGFDD